MAFISKWIPTFPTVAEVLDTYLADNPRQTAAEVLYADFPTRIRTLYDLLDHDQAAQGYVTFRPDVPEHKRDAYILDRFVTLRTQRQTGIYLHSGSSEADDTTFATEFARNAGAVVADLLDMSGNVVVCRYEEVQQYGGPEEGGWYYRTVYLEEAVRVQPEAAGITLALMLHRHDAGKMGNTRVYYTLEVPGFEGMLDNSRYPHPVYE